LRVAIRPFDRLPSTTAAPNCANGRESRETRSTRDQSWAGRRASSGAAGRVHYSNAGWLSSG
jgi:hypothetical protein